VTKNKEQFQNPIGEA